jgi:hypothetical protein
VFKSFNDNSTERIRPHLGETSPERRAVIEALVARYPDLAATELADLLHWYRREASAMDVALLASNDSLAGRFGAFCRAHVTPFGLRDKAITALLSAGVLGLFAYGVLGDVA